MHVTVLHYESGGAHAFGVRGMLLRGVSGVDDELESWRLGVQALENSKAARVSETQIENEDIRRPETSLVEGLGAGTHGTDELQSRLEAYELTENARNVRVVVHDEDASASRLWV